MSFNNSAYNSQGGTSNANDQLEQSQNQVNEVLGIMKSNVDKVLERDQKLADIGERTNELSAQSRQFEAVSRRVRRKYFWQNMKMWIVLGIVGVVLVIAIIIYATSGSKSSDEN